MSRPPAFEGAGAAPAQFRTGRAQTPRSAPEIILIRVAGAAEERAILNALKGRRRSTSGFVVPAFDSLVPGLSRIAAVCHCRLRIIEGGQIPAESAPPETLSGDPLSPGLAILTLRHVDPQLVALAEHLAGTIAITWADGADRALARARAVMVLFSAQTPTDEVWQTIALLARHDLPFGILCVDGAAQGRFSLLKALLFPAADVQDVDQIADLAAPGDAGGPPEVPGGPAEAACEARRLLLLSGHGNAVDVGGAGVVMCPRAEADASGSLAGIYPCFGDGLCFRQPLFGRSPRSRQGLIDPALLRYPLVLLLGCATLPIGGRPFDHRGTILWRLAGSDVRAAVAAMGIFYHDLNTETALLSLLLDGHELGEAVRIFNAWHRRAYGQTLPGRKGVGPLVAVGNPQMRLTSRLVQAFAISAKDGPVPSPTQGLSGNGFAILRLDGAAPVGNDGVALCTPPGVKGAGIRIGPPDGDAAQTYISVQAKAAPTGRPLIALRPFDRDDVESDIEAIRDSASHLPYWRLLMAGPESPMAEALGPEGACLAGEIGALDLERLVAEYLSVQPRTRDAALPAGTALAVHQLVMARWRAWHRLALEAACCHVRRTGGFLFHLWQGAYRRDEGAGEPPCPICGRQTRWLEHHSHTDPADRHHVVHCPACGVIGELPRGITVRAGEPKWAGGQRTLTMDFDFASERPAKAEGPVALIREDWFHEACDTAAAADLIIAPGARERVSFTLPVSPGLPGGLYPVTLVGVLNGGLVQIRSHVSIAEAAGPGRRA